VSFYVSTTIFFCSIVTNGTAL